MTKHPAHLPTTLRFEIGGFMGQSHDLWFKGGLLNYRTAAGAYSWGETIQISPGPEQWEAFWRTVDAADVWNWRAEYQDPGICDGTHWSLSLRYRGRTIRSQGSNAYPGAEGPEVPPQSSFEAWLEALRQLTGIREID